MEDDYLRYNPSDQALKELKKAHNKEGSKKRRKALTRAEQELFEKFMLNHPVFAHWYPIFEVMLWTGMRTSEICGLRWCDIDFENNVISINHNLVYYDKRSVQRCTFAVHEIPKTVAGLREIPMLPRVREAFLKEKAYRDETGIKCNVTIDGYTDFVFVNRFGCAQHQGTLNGEKICGEFRKSFCTCPQADGAFPV